MKTDIKDSIHILPIKDIKLHDHEINSKIGTFINECMKTYIGRPYKDRPDIINLEDYYLKNNGQFLIAYDTLTRQIVGTIAIQNKDHYGILKRFYVKKGYQGNGIGRNLYTTLEKFIIEQTNICKVYLACGSILKDAHKFYAKNGFSQVQNLDINMNSEHNDDYFVKNIERKLLKNEKD